MAITVRERYTQTTQSFSGVLQARNWIRDWLQTNHFEIFDSLNSKPTGFNLLWEVGGHSPVLDIDYQYRVELPGRPPNVGIPMAQAEA